MKSRFSCMNFRLKNTESTVPRKPEGNVYWLTNDPGNIDTWDDNKTRLLHRWAIDGCSNKLYLPTGSAATKVDWFNTDFWVNTEFWVNISGGDVKQTTTHSSTCCHHSQASWVHRREWVSSYSILLGHPASMMVKSFLMRESE